MVYLITGVIWSHIDYTLYSLCTWGYDSGQMINYHKGESAKEYVLIIGTKGV